MSRRSKSRGNGSGKSKSAARKSTPKAAAPQRGAKQSAQSKQSKVTAPVKAPVLHVEEAVEIERSALAKMSRGERRKHLDERLRHIYQRAFYIEKEIRELDENRWFRCVIFGSARIKPETKDYNDVFALARLLAGEGIDILTGGGPGLMEAANAGAKVGQKEKKTKGMSYGITIQLDFEPVPNSHIDVKRHHTRFSSRLDDFMRLSHCIVCTPGGIGTLLELYFTWQLIQVKHIERRPIVLLDKSYWTGIIEWMKQVPLARGLISTPDFSFVHIVDTPEEAYKLVSAAHQDFVKTRKIGKD